MQSRFFSKIMPFVMVVLFALAGALLSSARVQAASEATFTVNTTLADGFDNVCDATECALAEAIAAANATAAADTISFNIPPIQTKAATMLRRVCTITLTSDMPYVTAPVTINGYSQPGATVNTLDVGDNAQLKIELDGGHYYKPLTLDSGADGSLVKGLVFKNSGYDLKLISASDVAIEGNFFGVDADGNTQNDFTGVSAETSSDRLRVGGSTAAARNLFTTGGILVTQSNGATIQGNYIGTFRDGISYTTAVGRHLTVSNLTGALIGGKGALQRNTVNAPVLIWASDVVVKGNYIGLGADGVTQIGNGDAYVSLGSGAPISGNVVFNNRIANSNAAGIIVNYNNVANNTFSRNRIFANHALGIDLGNNGITANDLKDADTGANNLQNFPILTSSVSTQGRHDHQR